MFSSAHISNTCSPIDNIYVFITRYLLLRIIPDKITVFSYISIGYMSNVTSFTIKASLPYISPYFVSMGRLFIFVISLLISLFDVFPLFRLLINGSPPGLVPIQNLLISVSYLAYIRLLPMFNSSDSCFRD